MTIRPVDLTGGKSVYCFNQRQLNDATAMAREDTPEGRRVREEVARLESEFTRNERAAVAFLVIDRLNAG